MHSTNVHHIVVLPGDGIGPEVTAEAVRVLKASARSFGFGLSFETHDFGGIALDRFGDPFPESTQDACLRADAVLLGAIGGHRWDHEKGVRRPERGLLTLRKSLGVFANLRPVTVPYQLATRSPLRVERVAGTDLLIVRELTGGIYFGIPRGTGFNTMCYTEAEIACIASVAFRWARKRSKRVTSVDKANVLEVSQLWREVVTTVHRDSYADVTLDHLYVDNAAMQMILKPRQFDVILTANLFGDILSDLAATLPGSLGMLPSASLGGRTGVFEPVHGSAPDIAGDGIANPLGAILSGAMLLDDLGEDAAANAIRHSVSDVITAGLRTPDLGGTSSTQEIGAHVERGLVASADARLIGHDT